MAKKIAVFGGSFNPIHLGHIQMALCAKKECKLTKVIFLPNSAPPHKDNCNILDAKHRYNMVCKAIEPYEFFEISDYEMNRSEPSYTIDTMRHMKKIYNACELYFIIGADSLYTLDLWKNYDALVKECRFIVADRNCSQGKDLIKAIENHRKKGGVVELINMPKINIASTIIRNKIAKGESVSEFLPLEVSKYISNNKLYKSIPED